MSASMSVKNSLAIGHLAQGQQRATAGHMDAYREMWDMPDEPENDETTV